MCDQSGIEENRCYLSEFVCLAWSDAEDAIFNEHFFKFQDNFGEINYLKWPAWISR
jgi:hypothetical protein